MVTGMYAAKIGRNKCGQIVLNTRCINIFVTSVKKKRKHYKANINCTIHIHTHAHIHAHAHTYT